MKPVLIVVDEFYDDPDAIREMALALPFQYPVDVNYPGMTAPTPQDIRPIVARFSELLGGIDLLCRKDQGAFRVTTEADMVKRASLVHVDTPDYSAFIHLSPDGGEGTHFYRHRALGLERISPDDNRNPEVRRSIERDTLDPSAWEETHYLPMRYNRLILFDGKYFHSGARRLTGRTIADGRLTQNFFFFVAT